MNGIQNANILSGAGFNKKFSIMSLVQDICEKDLNESELKKLIFYKDIYNITALAMTIQGNENEKIFIQLWSFAMKHLTLSEQKELLTRVQRSKYFNN